MVRLVQRGSGRAANVNVLAVVRGEQPCGTGEEQVAGRAQLAARPRWLLPRPEGIRVREDR